MSTGTSRRPMTSDDGGQSLVEVALALPLLLLIVLGIVDVGRVYAFKTTTTNAAREAAFYAARDATALTGNTTGADGTVIISGICQHARDELGLGPSASPCEAAPLTVVCTRGGQACGNDTGPALLYQTYGAGGAEVSVTVAYDVSLLTGYLVGAAFRVNPVRVSATATFGSLTE